MIELFERRGMSREDAEVVITRMAKYKVKRAHAHTASARAFAAPRHACQSHNCSRLKCLFLFLT
eukprot:5534588-Pleurochrysis_carterae.AAC.2